MASIKPKSPVTIEGKTLVEIPTGDDVSAQDRVNALFHATLAEDVYNVSIEILQSLLAIFILPSPSPSPVCPALTHN
jgi:hypothetical protein